MKLIMPFSKLIRERNVKKRKRNLYEAGFQEYWGKWAERQKHSEGPHGL